MATVLIVDDAAEIRELVRHLLRPTPHEVVGEAADGAEAIEQWRALQPKVVLLDHMLPGMSGIEVAGHMLAEKPHQPIVLFTGYPDRELFREAEALGVAACVAKTDVSVLPGVLNIAAGEPSYPA